MDQQTHTCTEHASVKGNTSIGKKTCKICMDIFDPTMGAMSTYSDPAADFVDVMV
jgi:hypothetical protein